VATIHSTALLIQTERSVKEHTTHEVRVYALASYNGIQNSAPYRAETMIGINEPTFYSSRVLTAVLSTT
jgi:hypothetical protein